MQNFIMSILHDEQLHSNVLQVSAYGRAVQVRDLCRRYKPDLKCHAQAVAARLARPVEEMARCLKGVVFAYW